jgi:hypothetical protein
VKGKKGWGWRTNLKLKLPMLFGFAITTIVIGSGVAEAFAAHN